MKEDPNKIGTNMCSCAKSHVVGVDLLTINNVKKASFELNYQI